MVQATVQFVTPTWPVVTIRDGVTCDMTRCKRVLLKGSLTRCPTASSTSPLHNFSYAHTFLDVLAYKIGVSPLKGVSLTGE